MGRIRTVKPELLTHEVLFELEEKTGLPMRIAFVGLFTICDREGRFKWEPRRIKLAVLPYDSCDFSRVLDALMTREMVRKYIVDGVEYGLIPTFLKHQVINNRESPSEIPGPEETSYISSTSTREARVDDAIGTPLVQDQGEGKGKEGKGREGNRKGKEGEKSTAPSSDDALLFPEVSAMVVSDFKAHRKAKKAPITLTAMLGIASEAKKAGVSLEAAMSLCCTRGWTGFKAEWVTDRSTASAKQGQPSRHTGFDNLNYNEGIENGRF